jgi:hypothetical protein
VRGEGLGSEEMCCFDCGTVKHKLEGESTEGDLLGVHYVFWTERIAD